jgi:hypothetical protein
MKGVRTMSTDADKLARDASITALVIEDIAIKIENRCRELLHDTEWIGYETIILCVECQPIIDAIRELSEVGE